MKKLLICLFIITAITLTLAGCDNGNNTDASVDIDTDFAKDASEMFTDRDYGTDYAADESIQIALTGNSAECSSENVSINGGTVTIKSDGTYIISGTLEDGMIIVDAEDAAKPHIVLNGASVTSTTSASIYILEADKVIITLAEGTENVLSNGGAFTAIDDNNIDGTIFSKQDLTINGMGSLTVTSPVGHGIVCKDDLVVTGGKITVNSASHGLDANDSVRLCRAEITIDAGKDGIHAENSDDIALGFVYITESVLNIDAEGDGISSGAYMQIESGSLDITAGGGSENGTKASSDSYGGFMGGRPGQSSSSSSSTEDSTSMKAVKATGSLLINNGDFTIDAADDAIHSNTSVIINGGSFNIATGDDGVHADEGLQITGGTISISESYEGLEGLDIVISGGDITIVASDDGINAAGGNDSSGLGGTRPGGDKFGGGFGGSSSSSNGSIVISGGKIYMNASGDGIDANGTLSISGGHVTICGPTSGDTSVLDYDVSGTITGGTFIGTGAYQMAQTFSDSEQGVIALSVGSRTAGTEITVKDSGGNILVSTEPKLSYQIVIISSPDIKKGETYTVSIGTDSGEFEAN